MRFQQCLAFFELLTAGRLVFQDIKRGTDRARAETMAGRKETFHRNPEEDGFLPFMLKPLAENVTNTSHK